jgi:hypothetical protein
LDTLLKAPLAGFGTVAFGIFVSLAAARFAGLGGAPGRRTFALSTGIYSYGLCNR